MILHGFVPDAFGFGIIVHLMKDKTDDANSLNNYRVVTLIQVISKLFEILLLEYFENVFFYLLITFSSGSKRVYAALMLFYIK